MSILISLTESLEELISGIPKWVEISSSEPSIIYFTLDGSEPDENSLVFSERIYLPTSQNSVTLKYKAFYDGKFSSTCEEEYRTVFKKTMSSRRGGEDGVDIFNGTANISLYYNSSRESVQSSAIVMEDLDIKASFLDDQGTPTESTRSFVNFATSQIEKRYANVSQPSSVDFDKHANNIIIDGSTEEARANQIIEIVNRPYDNMTPRSSFYIESLERESNYLNGNLVSYVYNRNTGEIVFNYFDSRENRWTKSKQKIEAKGFNLSKVYSDKNTKVFRWISDPVGSRLR